MRILIINMFFYPNMMGGTEQSIKILAENLINKGNDVFIITIDGDDRCKNPRMETFKGTVIYRYYFKALYNGRIRGEDRIVYKINRRLHSVVNFKANKLLKELCRTIKPDIVHTNNLGAMSYWAWKFFSSEQIPVIHTLRDYWLMDPAAVMGKSHPLIAWLQRRIHKRMSNKYVDAVTAPSQYVLDIFNQYGYFKYIPRIRIANCIDLDDGKLTECIREKLCRENDNVSFLYAGQLSDNKGVKFLIEAFQKINCKNITLTICGRGILEKYVLSCIENSNNIIYKGNLDKSQLDKEYDKCDVLIVPSIWEEPFGRVIIEAAQFGMPTIASNRGGIPEIIQVLQCGECYNYDSETELIEKIIKFTNRNYLKPQIINIPKNIKHYTVDEQIKQFERVYYKLLKK